MSQQNRCPRCNSVIPPLASRCIHCAPQTTAEDMRFNVVKKGQSIPAASAGAEPVSAGLPADVLSIGESAQVWYCRIGGQIIGPVTAPEIRGAFGKGQIDGQAKVGIQGKQDWFPIRALPQFSNILTGIGPAPVSRPLPAPALAGTGLPGPNQARQRPAPVPLPPPARPEPATPMAQHPPGARPAVPPIGGAPIPVTSPDRDDKTELVPPLPPPGPVPGAQYATPVPSRNLPPPQAVLQDEIKRLKRLALIMGIVAGVLFITTAALFGLLAAG